MTVHSGRNGVFAFACRYGSANRHHADFAGDSAPDSTPTSKLNFPLHLLPSTRHPAPLPAAMDDSPFYCAASYSLDPSVWTGPTGIDDGPPLAFQRLDGVLTSLVQAPVARPGAHSTLSNNQRGRVSVSSDAAGLVTAAPELRANEAPPEPADAAVLRPAREQAPSSAAAASPREYGLYKREGGFSVSLVQLLPWVFPMGIRLYDPRRAAVGENIAAEPAHGGDGTTNGVNPVRVVCVGGQDAAGDAEVRLQFHDPAIVASGCALRGPSTATAASAPRAPHIHSSIHSFVGTASTADAAPFFGHVLTRWHPVTDPSRLARLRLQLGSLSVNKKSPGSVGAVPPEFRRGSEYRDGNTWSAEELRILESCDTDEKLLEAANFCWEPSAVLLLTGAAAPYYETMRALLLSFDAHLEPGARLGEAATKLLFAAVSGSEMSVFDVSTGAPLEGGPVVLPTESAGVFGAPQLLAATLPWCSTACAARNGAAHSTLPSKIFFPPSHSHSWELPQANWKCGECGNACVGVSRARLRAAKEAASGVAPSVAPTSPLSASIRCVETQMCLECTALKAGVPAAMVNAAVAGAHAAAAAGEDPLLRSFIGDESGATLASATHETVDATVPLPFCLPSACSGLSTLDVDPRALFSHVQPRHIIAVVTALLSERKVLVVSRDTSRLVDVIMTLTALIQPLMWAGVMIPIFPQYGLPPLSDLVSGSPIPMLVGCHPDTVRASPPAYHTDFGLASKYSDAEVSAAVASWEAEVPSCASAARTGSGDTGCSTTAGVGDEDALRAPWRPVPLRWWLRYAHLLDPTVAAWAEADARQQAEKEKAAQEATDARAATWGASWLGGGAGGAASTDADASAPPSHRAPESQARPQPHTRGSQHKTAPLPLRPEGAGSFDDGYAYEQRPDAFWGTSEMNEKSLSHLLQSTWVLSVGMGIPLPPATEYEGSRHEEAARRRAVAGVNAGAQRPHSSASLIILDIDADALSPAYLPPTHLLSPRLAARLWMACVTFAPLWSWARRGAPLPSPLPHFASGSPDSEVAAARELWRDFRARAEARGWSEAGLVRAESLHEAPPSCAETPLTLHFSSLFAPLRNGDVVILPHAPPAESGDRPSIFSRLFSSSVPLAVADLPPPRVRVPLSRAPASMRTIDFIHSDEEEDEAMVSGGFFSRPLPPPSADVNPFDSIDTAPLVLVPPWAQWRAAKSAALRAERALIVSGPQGAPVSVRVPEPPIHFSRVRLAFLSVFVSLVKAYRLYANIDAIDNSESDGESSPVSLPAAVVGGGAGGRKGSTPSETSAAQTPTRPRKDDDDSGNNSGSSSARRSRSDSLRHENENEVVTLARSRAFTMTPRVLDGASRVLEEALAASDSDMPRTLSATPLMPLLSSAGPQPPSLTQQPAPMDGGGANDSFRAPTALHPKLELFDIARPFLHQLGPHEGARHLVHSSAEADVPFTSRSSSSQGWNRMHDALERIIAAGSDTSASPDGEGDAVGASPLTPARSASTLPNAHNAVIAALLPPKLARQASARGRFRHTPAPVPQAEAGSERAVKVSPRVPVFEVLLPSVAVDTVNARLSSTCSRVPDGPVSASPVPTGSAVVIFVPAPRAPTRAPHRVEWDSTMFINAEASTSAFRMGVDSRPGSSEPLLSHVTHCTHWSAFVDMRLCRRWETIGQYFQHLRRWRAVCAAGRARAAEFVGGASSPPLLLLPSPPPPPSLPEPDIFDMRCFRRLLHRAHRLRNLRPATAVGTLWKANRGTLCKNWARRRFILSSNGIFAWYGHADELEAAEREVEVASARLPNVIAAAAAARGSSGGSSGGSPNEGEVRARADIDRAEARLQALRQSSYKDRFQLAPGISLLRIPDVPATALPVETHVTFLNNGSDFPTRFPFQIVTSSREHGKEILTLCAPSAEERRSWILHIRSHLRDASAAAPAWVLDTLSRSPSSSPITPDHLKSDDVKSRVPIAPFLRLLYLGDVDSLDAVAADEASQEAEAVSAGGVAAATATSANIAVYHVPLDSAGLALAAVQTPLTPSSVAVERSVASTTGGDALGRSVLEEYRASINAHTLKMIQKAELQRVTGIL